MQNKTMQDKTDNSTAVGNMRPMAAPKNSMDPQPIRDDLEEKAPNRQKGDKLAGLQPDAQDDGSTKVR